MMRWNLEHLKHPENIPDEDIVSVTLAWVNQGLVQMNWCVKGVGFGQFNLVFDRETGKITRIDSETLSRAFIGRLLTWLVNQSPVCE